jgi:hypothetical protein
MRSKAEIEAEIADVNASLREGERAGTLTRERRARLEQRRDDLREELQELQWGAGEPRRRKKMRRPRTKTMAHYRKNPLTTTEFVIGGLVTAAVVGTGFYVLYNYFNNPANNLAQVNAATGQAPLPGGTGAPTASQIGVWAAQNQGALAQAQGGQPAPTTGTTYVSQ